MSVEAKKNDVVNPWQVMLHARRVFKKSWFEGRFDGTLFEGMIVRCASKVPYRLGMRELMSI